MDARVLLVGLTARDDRLIEIVLTRAPNARHRYTVRRAVDPEQADIVIVDAASPEAERDAALLAAAARPTIYISDAGDQGPSPYRLERRSLLLRLLRMVDEIIESAASRPAPRTTPVPVPVPGRLDRLRSVPKQEVSVFSRDAQDAAKQHDFRPLRALVVDDSDVVRMQLQEALKAVGVTCVAAGDAAAAELHLQRDTFDLALLDVVMPGVDGYDLCRRIKQNAYTRGIPVLMLTSRSSPFDRARGALAGCDAYLTKPINPDAFYAAVDKQLRRHFRNDERLLISRGYRAHA
jgi:twitching motility two-component system response regulator PilG